ncbi:MAG: ATP-binding cassette domain-containing protein [Candidatus Eisenbacteria bacterium]|nr:ATP-binding cassette domain-containing protein [Candidatus Eisenbacteria bacterium]
MRIALKDVTVRYDAGLPSATTALSGVGLAVEQGECVAVIGPTGSGKTTLLEVMAGLATPTSGVATVEPVGAARGLRDIVGLAYQFPESQFFEETVFADVAFGPARQGLAESEIRVRVEEALTRAGLPAESFGERMPLSLSAGEKRRAAIAGILALSRPFLLLDEPTAGLDPTTAERIVDLVRSEVRAERGVVVVTHDLEFVEVVASRTVVMGHGAVLADRTTVDAFSDAALFEGLGLEPPPRYALMDRLRRLPHPEFDRISLVLSGPRGVE